MEKLKFQIDIAASPQLVWKVLWGDVTYTQWTSVFSEGSRAETDWKEGSKVHFLAADKNGMYSVIDKSVANEFMSFKHLGVIKDGIEQPQDEETKKWSGSMENYTLKEKSGTTELSVELDIVETHKDYFNDVFPKALQLVKKIAEQ